MLMIGIEGEKLEERGRQRLEHPLVGGVLILERNYSSRSQLKGLIEEMRSVSSELIIAVDQEGGRVQRLQEGFTRLPTMRTIGEMRAKDPQAARQYAHDCGIVIATELKAVGVDVSFTPVLDLDRGSSVINDRAFSENPAIVTELAGRLIDGLHCCGSVAVGKHFPGHGSVMPDTHKEVVHDERCFEDIMSNDAKPFIDLVAANKLDAVMFSHIIYPSVDDQPASLSVPWLHDMLRQQIGFQGFVFSDDIGMAGSTNPDILQIKRALNAGCNMIITSNDHNMTDRIIDSFDDAEAMTHRAGVMQRWREINDKAAGRCIDNTDYEAAVSRLIALDNDTFARRTIGSANI